MMACLGGAARLVHGFVLGLINAAVLPAVLVHSNPSGIALVLSLPTGGLHTLAAVWYLGR